MKENKQRLTQTSNLHDVPVLIIKKHHVRKLDSAVSFKPGDKTQPSDRFRYTHTGTTISTHVKKSLVLVKLSKTFIKKSGVIIIFLL